MSVKIDFNIQGIINGIEMSNEYAVTAMTEQALQDSNYYAPADTYTLQKKAEINSDFKNGLIVWEGPEAQYLYYGLLMVGTNGSAWAKFGERKHVKTPHVHLNFSHDKNPNAQMEWYDKAKNVHFEDWLQTYRKVFSHQWQRR